MHVDQVHLHLLTVGEVAVVHRGPHKVLQRHMDRFGGGGGQRGGLTELPAANALPGRTREVSGS